MTRTLRRRTSATSPSSRKMKRRVTASGGGLLERINEHAHLADREEPGEMLRPVEHGNAGRIVAAVLEPPQTLHEDRYDIALGDRSNDSAHGFVPRLDALPTPKAQAD